MNVGLTTTLKGSSVSWSRVVEVEELFILSRTFRRYMSIRNFSFRRGKKGKDNVSFVKVDVVVFYLKI